MGEKKELPRAGAGGVGSREMLQGRTPLGAGLAAPGGVHAHLAAPARAAAQAKAAGGALVFFDKHQFATVSRLCALIVERPEGSPSSTTLRDHFDHLKRWVSDSYHTSEAGLKELGYTGNMLFVEFPDCTHPEHQ